MQPQKTFCLPFSMVVSEPMEVFLHKFPLWMNHQPQQLTIEEQARQFQETI